MRELWDAGELHPGDLELACTLRGRHWPPKCVGIGVDSVKCLHGAYTLLEYGVLVCATSGARGRVRLTGGCAVQVCRRCHQNDKWAFKLFHHQTSLCKTQRQQKNFVNLGLLPRGCCGFTLFEVKETDTNACIALQHKRKRCCETQV